MPSKLAPLVALLLVPACATPERAVGIDSNPLPSWNDGPTRERIIEFVSTVTDPEDPGFVPPERRIATFDNDGTLWSEKPVYFQLLFAMDRVRELAAEHPEWEGQQPFKAVLEGKLDVLAQSGEQGLIELIMATHAGMSTAEFNTVVEDWLASARHPELDRPYIELVYQPMLELLQYLRDNGFQTWIVSGGGIEFMRPWVDEVYGIPPQQVVGSLIETEYRMTDDGPVLMRQPKFAFIDDKGGKPVAISRFIGLRPIAAFGNSDGDLQMLQWTAAGDGERLMGLVHHTDADREWAYDKDSHVGRLDEALIEARAKGWTVIDMKNDWQRVYPGSHDAAAPDAN